MPDLAESCNRTEEIWDDWRQGRITSSELDRCLRRAEREGETWFDRFWRRLSD